MDAVQLRQERALTAGMALLAAGFALMWLAMPASSPPSYGQTDADELQRLLDQAVRPANVIVLPGR
jgi:hypothetical protein